MLMTSEGLGFRGPYFPAGAARHVSDHPHLPPYVGHLAQEVDVIDGQAEQLALAHPGPGAQIGQHPEPAR
jgi:hypothetical protein